LHPFSRRFRSFLPIALATALLAACPAHAATAPTQAELDQARERFAEARRLEDAGRWGEALELFQRVAAVKMTPQVRFHIALCMENVGLWTQALDTFTQAANEARATAPQVLTEANEHIRKLEAELPTVSLHVRGAAPGDELLLDRRSIPIDESPLPLRADPGPHSAEVRRNNTVVAREHFTLEPKSTRRIELEVGSVISAPKTSHEHTTKSPPPTTPDTGKTQRMLGWTAVGVSAASAIATGVFIGLRSGALGRLEEACPALIQCPPSIAPVVSEGKTYAALVNVFGILSGVAATGGAILLLTAPSSPAPNPPPPAKTGVMLHPVLGPGAMGLSMEGAF